MKARKSELESDAAKGTASIISTPERADIFIDSVGRGRTPLIAKLLPGKHSLQLAASGYKDWVSEIDVKAGSVVNISATLQK